MENIIMWGNGSVLKDFSDKSIFRDWKEDIDELSSWFTEPTLGADAKSRCRIAEKTSEIPPIILVGPCNSSIDMAWYFYRKGMLPEWGAVLTPKQWAGKGQFGRDWFSPPGNLYGALRLPASFGSRTCPASIIMGYLMMTGLEKHGVAAQLKWPNDILVKGRKVGGILIEERAGILIAGVGLNLVSSPSCEQLRHPHAISAGILNEQGYDFTPFSLWLDLVKHARNLYCNYNYTGDLSWKKKPLNKSLII